MWTSKFRKISNCILWAFISTISRVEEKKGIFFLDFLSISNNLRNTDENKKKYMVFYRIKNILKWKKILQANRTDPTLDDAFPSPPISSTTALHQSGISSRPVAMCKIWVLWRDVIPAILLPYFITSGPHPSQPISAARTVTLMELLVLSPYRYRDWSLPPNVELIHDAPFEETFPLSSRENYGTRATSI